MLGAEKKKMFLKSALIVCLAVGLLVRAEARVQAISEFGMKIEVPDSALLRTKMGSDGRTRYCFYFELSNGFRPNINLLTEPMVVSLDEYVRKTLKEYTDAKATVVSHHVADKSATFDVCDLQMYGQNLRCYQKALLCGKMIVLITATYRNDCPRQLQEMMRKSVNSTVSTLPDAMIGIDSKISKVVDAVEKAHRLINALLFANKERNQLDVAPIWAKWKDPIREYGNEIQGKTFVSARQYFDALFDVHNATGTPQPYVVNTAYSDLSLSRLNSVDWIVAAGVKNASPDNQPILISANVDPKVLQLATTDRLTRQIAIGKKSVKTEIPWGDDYVVVAYKDGTVSYYVADEFTVAALFRNNRVVDLDVRYLPAE